MPDRLIERLKELERLSKSLEPTTKQRELWLEAITHYTDQFYESLPNRPTYQPSTSLDPAITDLSKTENLSTLLEVFHNSVVGQGLDTASGRFLGQIPGGGIYPSALGDYIAALANTYAASAVASPGAVAMEKALITWLADMFGFPPNSTGNLTSGGSIANMIAIVTARDAHHIHADNIPKAVIYLSSITHHCVTKCLNIIGLSDAIIRTIPVDSNYKIDLKLLEISIDNDIAQGLKPWLLIGNAGTTDTGSIDPLDKLSAIANKHRLWFHVDAAYGGFFILTPQGKKALRGIENADSIVVDPHKGLFISYGLGAVITKHPSEHLHSFESDAPYMQDVKTTNHDWSPYDVSPELTKHFRAVRLWLSIKLLGIQPFADCLEEKLLLAQYFHQELAKIPNIDVACQPELSVVAFRLKTGKQSDQLTKSIHDTICQKGQVYLSSTTLNGDYYIRMACLSFRTHLREIQLTLNLLQEAIDFCLSHSPEYTHE